MLEAAGLTTETVEEKDKDVTREDAVDLDAVASETKKEEEEKDKKEEEDKKDKDAETQTFSKEEEDKIKVIAEKTNTKIEDIKAGKGSDEVIKLLKSDGITIKSKSVSGGSRRKRSRRGSRRRSRLGSRRSKRGKRV